MEADVVAQFGSEQLGVDNGFLNENHKYDLILFIISFPLPGHSGGVLRVGSATVAIGVHLQNRANNGF